MAKKTVVKVCATAVLMAVSFTSSATSEEVRVELKNVVKEFAYLRDRIVDISKLQRVDDTEKVDFQALLRDLKLISDGLKRHIDAPSRQPRVIEPLEGVYGSIR